MREKLRTSRAADAEAPHTLPPPAIGEGASCGAAVILDWDGGGKGRLEVPHSRLYTGPSVGQSVCPITGLYCILLYRQDALYTIP